MIHIKAKQQNVSFEKNVEKLAFVLSAHLYNTLDTDKVIEEAAKRSGMSDGVIKAAWDAAGEVIRTWATEGHNVPLPGLGSMRFSVRSKSVQNIEDVKTSLITARRVIFTPSKEVKRVTSTDDAEVEDDNSLTPDPSPTGEGSGNTGGNTGGSGGGNEGGGGFESGGD